MNIQVWGAGLYNCWERAFWERLLQTVSNIEILIQFAKQGRDHPQIPKIKMGKLNGSLLFPFSNPVDKPPWYQCRFSAGYMGPQGSMQVPTSPTHCLYDAFVRANLCGPNAGRPPWPASCLRITHMGMSFGNWPSYHIRDLNLIFPFLFWEFGGHLFDLLWPRPWPTNFCTLYTTNPNEHLPSNGRATVEQPPSSTRRAAIEQPSSTAEQLSSNRRAIARRLLDGRSTIAQW